jgi:hypothetical protein
MSVDSNIGISLNALATGTTAPNVSSNLNLFISGNCFYSQITVAGTGNSAISLPLNPQLGSLYTIRNDSGCVVQVFAPTTTSTLNMIGGALAGPCLLAGGSVSFIAVSNNGNANTNTGANPYNNPAIVYHEVASTNVGPNQVVAMGTAASVNLNVAQSGTTFLMNPTQAQTVNLPIVAACTGVSYKFISTTANPGFNYTITPQTSVLSGLICGASTFVACQGKATIATVSANILIGDFIELFSDGVNWYVKAYAKTSGAFA